MMKGLVIWKDGHASLEEMKKPEIGEYQALVRVTAGALCGTDKETYRCPEGISQLSHGAWP